MAAASHQPQLARLLEVCTGSGATVLVTPESDEAGHHFYAGLGRPPVGSLIEGLLLTLGGTLPDGQRRYHEIVVVNAGVDMHDGTDKPSDEQLRIVTDGDAVVRGKDWETWWFRAQQPAPAQPVSTTPQQPVPFRDPWKSATPIPADRFRRFPHQVMNESGANYPNRYVVLKRIIDELSRHGGRCALLVELAALDYNEPPASVLDEHAQISEVGIQHLEWLNNWINQVERNDAHTLDLVFFSRGMSRGHALLTTGLPRRPSKAAKWPAFAYQGRSIEHIRFPGGAHPWHDRFAGTGVAFERNDGMPNDTPANRAAYSGRTLPALLRGHAPHGGAARIRVTPPPPMVPRINTDSVPIDRDFWGNVDVDAVEAYFHSEYFGSDYVPVVRDVIAELRWRRTICRADSQHLKSDATQKRWRKHSSLVLWGEGGAGKSHFPRILSQAVFGAPRHLVSCQNSPGEQMFKAQIYGAAAGYTGSASEPALCAFLRSSRGYGVVVLDEFNTINSTNFSAAAQATYALVEDREYKATNSALHNHAPLSLWNTMFVLTANLASWPPASVSAEHRGAIARRFRAYEFGALSPERVNRCAEWILCREAAGALGGVSTCSTQPLDAEIEALRLSGRTPDLIGGELASPERKLLERLAAELDGEGLNVETAPLHLDVTAILRRILR